jgi:hypothetical protein
VAAFGTILMTGRTANRQIAAAREEADRMVAAARAQTEAAFKQTEATIRSEDLRNASEARAFHVMLEAAMARVLAEAAWARETYLPVLTQTAGLSLDGLLVRQCFTKGAFAELRAACVRRGGDLTGEFLDLEREIDSFASQYDDRPTVTQSVTIRMGKLAGLDEQLALIEKKATALREKAFERFGGKAFKRFGGKAFERFGGAMITAPGPFATAEAEALIGAPAPPVSAPKRRSWLRYWFSWKTA